MWSFSFLHFILMERRQPFFLIAALRLIVRKNPIKIKCDP